MSGLIESEERAPGIPRAAASACNAACQKAVEAFLTDQTLNIIESYVQLGLRDALRAYLSSQITWHSIDVFYAGRKDALKGNAP